MLSKTPDSQLESVFGIDGMGRRKLGKLAI
jgi:hypothetical protein